MEEKCDCCKVIKGCVNKCYQKILVPLEGGWVLNHYGGSDTYLGRLVLQTQCHYTKWEELQNRELKYLGKNIQLINICLRKFWEKAYPKDCIEQIYATYFNEAPYKKGLIGDKLNEELHVHIHLLPRTKEMREAMCCSDKLGWHLVDCISCFPDDYKLTDKNYIKAKELMEYLKSCLSTTKIE